MRLSVGLYIISLILLFSDYATKTGKKEHLGNSKK